jgi:hypothetical protein
LALPSVAALYLNKREAPDWLWWETPGHGLTPAWTFDAIVLILSGLLVPFVGWAVRRRAFASTANESKEFLRAG